MNNLPLTEDVRQSFPEFSDLVFHSSGGYKAVYKGIIDNVPEALKAVYIPTDNEDTAIENIRRISREIDLLGEMEDSHFVRLGRLGKVEKEINGHKYIFYSEEFLQGRSVRELMNENPHPDISQIALLCSCIFSCIKELKKKRIVHRDIKPDNIYYTGILEREFVLLDFGVAFLLDGTSITPSAHLIPGTLNYLAPEMLQADFRRGLDYRADLYSAGLTIYEFATSSNPFSNIAGIAATLQNIRDMIPVPMYKRRPDLPQGFCNLIDQLLKKIPALRPGNIDKIIQTAGEYL